MNLQSAQNRRKMRPRAMVPLILKEGKRVRGDLINLWIYEKNPAAVTASRHDPLQGIIVSRKVDAKATRRNRWRRRIREAFRQNRRNVKSGVLIVIQSKKQPDIPSFHDIESELRKLLIASEMLCQAVRQKA